LDNPHGHRKVHHVEAYWSRSDSYRSAVAVRGYGAEGWAVILSFVAFLVDEVHQGHKVISSQEINRRQTEQQREDQAKRFCTSRLHEADGIRPAKHFEEKEAQCRGPCNNGTDGELAFV